MYRRTRRNRLRYRKCRFLNRRRNQALAPSVNQKVESHIKLINWIKSFLPIIEIIYEGGTFDPHKLKNPDIKNYEYSKGEMYDFQNTKAYILERDHYACCFNDSCAKKLHVHHIIEKSKGGSNNPSNLITLCEKHHKLLHSGLLELKNVKPKILKTSTMMNIVRSQVFKKVSNFTETFGYLTKIRREELDLVKSHVNDAFVIANGRNQYRIEALRLMLKRKNNRCLQTNRKGYRPSIRRCRHQIQPHDIVKYGSKLYKSLGVQGKGKEVIILDGRKKLIKGSKKVEVIFHSKTLVNN